jgi:hypothetical protein
MAQSVGAKNDVEVAPSQLAELPLVEVPAVFTRVPRENLAERRIPVE